MRNSVKCFPQIQVDDIICSSLIHQCSNPITEGHHTCQALLALGEAMLAVTNHLLIFHVPLHSFQEYLLQDLAGHRGGTDWPVVPWVYVVNIFISVILISLIEQLHQVRLKINSAQYPKFESELYKMPGGRHVHHHENKQTKPTRKQKREKKKKRKMVSFVISILCLLIRPGGFD